MIMNNVELTNKKDLEKVSQIITDSINRIEALIECKD